jgi:hypothetical protein
MKQGRFALALPDHMGHYTAQCRAIAQLGSAFVWGTKGRGFESRWPDHFPKMRSTR